MNIDIDNLYIIKEHFYTQEIEFLEAEIGHELPENLNAAIKYCEEEHYTDWIAYNLLLLKKELQEIEKK